MSADGGGDLPAWYARRNIEPFTLSDPQIQELVDVCNWCTVAWVTRNHEPVQEVALCTVVDGHICVTSTTNRAKYHARRRNRAASITLVHPENWGRMACLRGRMELVDGRGELERFVRALLSRRPLDEERWASGWPKFAAPDRLVMRFHRDAVVSHDLTKLGWAERTGTDVWSRLAQGDDPFPQER